MPRHIVVIGAHAAGVDAASVARRTDREVEITLITRQKQAGYSRCGIPFVIGRHIPSFDKLIVFPQSYFRMMKLNLKLETNVKTIDTEKKSVDIEDITGKKETLKYDNLILTTGASPFIPPIKGHEKKGIQVLRTIKDGKKIDQAISNGAKKPVVMGAGLIGLETAIALRERGLKPTVVELLPQILPAMLDADMAKDVHEMLEQKGLRIMVSNGVQEFLGSEEVTGIIAGGEQIDSDLIIAAFGVRANTQLAKEAGITIGETRGIKTNMRMETNVQNVFAAGDCAESINMITGRPTLCQLGTAAVRQAKVAGTNAAGGYSIFPGVLGSAVTKFFDTEMGVTGLTEFFAKRAGFKTVTGKITSKTRPEYYPGGLPLKIKITVDKESHRIIGGQIVGGEEVTQRINALSFAVQKHMTVQELAKADTAYAPPLNETWEPMVLAAEIALRRLR
ncbi:MAG: FAD-dependent oxidoreductase [Candidatus Bathyarchaeota archaeon]|jgi:NADH oxidase (H2O2-forming)